MLVHLISPLQLMLVKEFSLRKHLAPSRALELVLKVKERQGFSSY